MSNLRELNQQNPLADLLAAFGAGGGTHPFFAAFNPEARDRGPPPSYRDNHTPTSSDDESANPHPPPPPPPANEGEHPHHGPHGEHPSHHHRGPHPGHRRGGGFCGRGGWRGGPRHAGSYGPWPGMMGGGGFDMNRLGDFISQFIPEDQRPRSGQAGENGNSSSTGGKDFAPEADIFDTEHAFVVHVSLPGAKKEDVGVNWNADSSELSVAGVIYRPGSEDFLKTLALDERKVGVFERKIKLGSQLKPALVEADAIAAKMEDGILIVTIPKVEKEYVEVRKVDIE